MHCLGITDLASRRTDSRSLDSHSTVRDILTVAVSAIGGYYCAPQRNAEVNP